MSERVMQFARETIAFTAHRELFQRGRLVCEVGICLAQ
jgi:hypothetical protein